MKIFITGGGTGGHLYPAIAIIESLLKKSENIKIYYFGNRKSLEERIVYESKLNITFIPLKTTGFFNKSLFKKLVSLYNVILSFILVYKYFKSIKPDFVIGTGGYVSAPVLLSSIFFRIPYALQEQNIIPGFANQFFGKFAKYIFLGFNESKIFFRKKNNLLYTGNPIRNKFSILQNNLNTFEEDAEIIIIGGSGGAKSINMVLPNVVKEFSNTTEKFLHITGIRDFEKVLDLVKLSKIKMANYEIQPYIHNIWDRLKNAKLVICRAGAITLSEIIVLKIPLILVPYPFAVRNHQYWNAYKFKKIGIAELILDKNLDAEILSAKIKKILYDKKYFDKIMNHYKKISFNNASTKIVDIIFNNCEL
jgi:UDP-N-acetylglucosamine--N-acetylmuramyl-(pentapeptide) pyrophosphoryl-undecaprenol N-acetylglucosamine transferase